MIKGLFKNLSFEINQRLLSIESPTPLSYLLIDLMIKRNSRSGFVQIAITQITRFILNTTELFMILIIL